MGKSTKTASRGKKAEEPSKSKAAAPKQEVDISDHLPPLVLVFTVMACSGFLFMYAFRDVFATGRNIGGDVDEAYLVRFVCEELLLDGFPISRFRLDHTFLLTQHLFYPYHPRSYRRSPIPKHFSITTRAGNHNKVVSVPSLR